MRKYIKYYLLITFLFAGIALRAQSPVFKVECGNDTSFCFGLYHNTLSHIGTQVKLMNGVPPYTYFWSCKPIIQEWSAYLIFTASDFLNDTSILDPYLNDCGIHNNPWVLYLTVKY